jgi:hypothetical protein
MNLKSLLESIHESPELSSPEGLRRACELIIHVQQMSAGERETVLAAYKHGPLYDGDVPSKASRDLLLRDGLIAKVVVKGADGYNALTYRGRDVHRLIEAGV